MIKPFCLKDIQHRACTSRLRIHAPRNHSRNPCLHNGSGTHLTRFQRHIHGAAFQSPVTDYLCRFSNGKNLRMGKCGFIDTTGDVAIAIQYDYVGNFENGLAIVGSGEDFYYIDVEGNFVRDYDDNILRAKVPDFMD